MNKPLTLGKSILEISYNPFYLAELIITVVSGFNTRKSTLMDTYVFLPLLLYKDTRNALEHTNAAGSIYRLFLKNHKKDLAGLNCRIADIKKLTNETLLLALSKNWITINDINLEIGINKKLKSDINNKRIKERGIYDSANNLGKILSKNETHENYRLLGVDKI